MAEKEPGISTPEMAPEEELMGYAYELPEDNMHYTIKFLEDGKVAELKIMNEDDSVVYEHGKNDGEIDTELLHKELKDIGLQELSIVSVVEKFRSVA